MNPFEAHGGHGVHGWAEGSVSVLPIVGALALLLVLAATLVGLYLWRQGKLPWGRGGGTRPEEQAKHVLADRFARGDISSEEFIERASFLNWTPGIAPAPQRGLGRRRTR